MPSDRGKIAVECISWTRTQPTASSSAAREEACNLFVMGSYGRRGLSELLLGSRVAKVLALSSVPILVWK